MSGQFEHESQSDTATQDQTVLPPLFCVVMHNDDYTTMDFVVLVLMDVFGHSAETATGLMMKIHTQGRTIVAILPKEIAEMKIDETTRLAEQAEFPLLLTLEST